MNHGVDQFSITEAVAAARLRQQIWRVGHGLHAAGDDNFRFAKLYGLRSQCHGFEPGTANLVDRERRNARIAATLKRSLASRVLAQPGLNYIAEDSFVDLLGVEPGAASGLSYDLGAQFGSGETGEPALKFPHRRADSRKDDGSLHGNLQTPLYEMPRSRARFARMRPGAPSPSFSCGRPAPASWPYAEAAA